MGKYYTARHNDLEKIECVFCNGGGDRYEKHVSQSMAPMDYDLIAPISEALDISSRNVYVVAVLDTNVLLSHFSFLERVFREVQDGCARQGFASACHPMDCLE